jgi:hypothetical protein
LSRRTLSVPLEKVLTLTPIWFEDSISFSEIKIPLLQKTETKATLISILHQGYLLNPDFIKNESGHNVTTHLTFPKKITGNSSILINNIAQWLN